MIRTLFKAEAPFMDVQTGYGYQGVVMYDDNEDKVQCHICGEWFVHVGLHAFKKHKVKSDDYKIRFGLSLRTGLCSVGLSNSRRLATERAIERGEIRQDIATQSAKYGRLKYRSMKRRQNGAKIMQWVNAFGLCDLQIKNRYDIVKSIVGHEPYMSEIIKYDSKLYHCGIVKRYGNLENFKNKLGILSEKLPPSNKIETTELIASLRQFSHDNKRLPKVTDFNGRHKAFYRVFGSWKQALNIAGLK
jgi:hypothetical protein